MTFMQRSKENGMNDEKPRIIKAEEIPTERTHNLSTEGLTDRWPRPLPIGSTIVYRIRGTITRGTGKVIQAGQFVIMIEEGLGKVKFIFYTELINVYLTG